MFRRIKQDIKGGFCPGRFLSGRDYVRGGFCPGGFCPGGFCPGGFLSYMYIQIISTGIRFMDKHHFSSEENA